ncbi:hypothetical protein like AT5G01140 [Hibiscus trionum]|uniref:DUF674 family protein n=1 Tax=Hibiscus trionum TaxID=183268 RepID=A0A9W7HZ42_HIBTR|nr:hypothetical protein like AT5G01140 [Hibiscus trionum]
MAFETPTISIKLLIDQDSNAVLLAEAGNDFVDTLHSLLKLPLGNIVRLVDQHQSLQPGCLNNLYNSVQNLPLKNFRTEACKRMLLYPSNAHEVEFTKLKLNMDLTGPRGHFVCGNQLCNEKQGGWFSYYNTPICTCGGLMNVRATKLRESVAVKDETEGVLYKGESMFFITDDLRVLQGSTGDLIQILLNLGIKNVNSIEEKVVEFGSREMTHLLIHSLISKTTLTDAFLRKQGIGSSSLLLNKRLSFISPIIKETAEKDGRTRVKLMLRKSDMKLLYAEASEDFVDLVFSFLTIPRESALELILGAKCNLTLGSISNLFRDLNTMFSVSNQKNSQKGVLPPFYSSPNEFPNIRSRDPPEFCYYFAKRSSTFPFNTFYDSRVVNKPFDPKSPVPSTTNSSGYLEKNSFVITDDLVVKPLSLLSSISLLKELGILLDDVEQKVISIREVEAIALLGACLWSSSALSASLNFFAKKPKQEPL